MRPELAAHLLDEHLLGLGALAHLALGAHLEPLVPVGVPLACELAVLPRDPAALVLALELLEVGRQLEHLPVVAPGVLLVGVAASVVLPRLAVGRVDTPPAARLVLRLLQLLLQPRRRLALPRLLECHAQVGHRVVVVLVVGVRLGARLQCLAHACRAHRHAGAGLGDGTVRRRAVVHRLLVLAHRAAGAAELEEEGGAEEGATHVHAAQLAEHLVERLDSAVVVALGQLSLGLLRQLEHLLELLVLLPRADLVGVVLEHAAEEGEGLLAVAQLERRRRAQRHGQHARLTTLPAAVRGRRLDHTRGSTLGIPPPPQLLVGARL
mmetsp:Transcript_73477/g.177283  ORF Transcript_73477/g.177283 Transcript_73477/m.177283 type:complete len:323 (-) Transcript_73477:556-1524(-)